MQNANIMTSNSRLRHALGAEGFALLQEGETVLVSSTGAKIRRIRGGLVKVLGYAASGLDVQRTCQMLEICVLRGWMRRKF